MKKIFTFSIVLMSFLYTEIKAQSSYTVRRGERPPIDLQALPNDAYEKGILKIKIDESFTNQMDINPVIVNENGIVSFNITSIDQLNQKYRPTGFDKLFGKESPSSKFYERHRAWGFHLWYTLYFDEKTDIKELVAAYGQLDEISIAEPQYKTELLVSEPITSQTKSEDEKPGQSQTDWTPNDPSFNLQWHYHNTGQQGGTVDADIDLPEAWNIEKGNSNVIVSIHDMGVQYNHPDLSGNMWINSDEIAGNGIDDDSNGYIDDIYGYDFYNNNGSIEAGYHGTHVAGTVAAESNNLIGVSGVAGGSGSNDGVRLMTCMVYHPTIGGGVGHHLAPVYAADNGACIEQNSWGYTNPNSYDQAVLDAIDYFNINGGGTALSGGITIYAAGNSNSNGNYYPGCYSGTFAVAATNNQDIKAWYSNYGTWVDISAPGGETDVLAARGVYSTYTTNTYNYLQGTSMACPHVSGVAALIVSYAYGELSASEVADILRNTTDNHYGVNPGYIGQLGTGRLNAYQALLETENYLGTPGLWTGTVSTSWNNGANWDDGTVPTSAVDVTIPAGTPYQPVISAGMTAYAKNLTIQSGALLTHTGTTNSWLYVYGDFNSDAGQYTMTGISFLYFAGSVSNSWDDDNENDTYVNVRVEKDLGSNANTYMWQNMTCSGTFEIREGIFSIDQYWTLNITNTGTTAFEVEAGGNLILDAATEVITVAGNIHFFDGSQATLTNGTINCAKDFIVDANASYNIAFTGGTLVMNGSSTQYINDLDGGNLDLFNLTIAKTGGVCYLQSANLDVNGIVLISGGALSANNAPSPTASYNIKVGSNWTNTVGAGGFVPGAGTVVFHSLTGTAQDAEGINTFYNVLQDNTGQYLRFNLTNGNTTIQNNLELHHYSWAYRLFNVNGILNIDDVNSRFTSNGPNGVATIASLNQGGRLISNGGGSLTVNDLVENGLFGSYYANSASDFMQITNSGTGTYVDLAADLHILGGTMKINGTISWWPYGGNAAIEMTGGVLDLTGCGIYINNNVSLSLNDNITGGTIRTIGGFSGNRADFAPTAGVFEFYGPTDAAISQSNGCTLYNVNINKGAKDGFISKPELAGSDERKDETWGGGGKANSISLGSNFTITNNLTITAGSFVLNGFQANVNNDCDVYGSLVMTNAADVLNVGTENLDNLIFYPGSVGNLSAGSIYLKSWIVPMSGCSFTATTGNTIYFTGSNTSGGLGNNEPTAVYGNVDCIKTANRVYLDGGATYPIVVNGTFNVEMGNILEMQDESLIIHGTMIDNATSQIYAYNAVKDGSTVCSNISKNEEPSENIVQTPVDSGSKGGYLEIDPAFTLNGLLDVDGGNVLIHGLFNVAASGTLTISTGSLICDAPSTSVAYVAGNFNLGEGLYEIRNNSLNMYPVTSSITGGIIKAGGTFIANMADRFKPGFGTVELINGVNGHYIQMNSTNYFNHLIVNRAYPIGIYSGTSLTVKKDLTINAGGLNSNSLPIYLGGHWNENMGPSGFGEGTGTVFFNGTGAINHQFINGNETFYNIENAKSGGGYLNIAGPVTVANNYLANGTNIISSTALTVNGLLNLATGELGLSTSAPNVIVNNFTMGGVLSVTNGNFTCTDVTNNGIFGTITLNNGSITLNQDLASGSWPDLNATVNLHGGYMAVNGGQGQSVWGFAAPCSIIMDGGVLDFNNNGIYIGDSYAITQNITGGTIKTNYSLGCTKSTFIPTGGTFEFYGGMDASIYTTNGSNIFNLLVNKSGGDKEFSGMNFETNKDDLVLKSSSNSEFDASNNPERPKFPDISSKSNTFYTIQILKVNGTTTVEEGTFLVDNYTATCMGNINVNAGGKLAIGDYGTLAIETGKILSVNNGGFLDLAGSVGGAATITHNTGFYALNVESGGTIGAVYGVFEYMNTNGVNIKNGALVDVAKPFNNCTFRNGQAAGRLMSVENNQTFYVENAVFPPNTWGGAYNVYKAVNAGGVYFVTATGGFAGATYEYDPNSRIFWTERSLSLKAYLEGPFNGTNMNTTLNGILPLSHPFNPALPYFGNPLPDWRYTGAGNVGAIPNVNIVDWVLVELRDAASAAAATKATMIAQFPAFILNNGNIVSLSGSSNLQFSNVIVNNLFVVIYQRNHVSIMNASPVPYTAGAYTYDYTTGAAQVYGGAPAHKQMATGIWGMRSGDGNGDCDVLMNDKTQVWGIPTQLGKTGYLPSDYNFDRQTNNKDKNDKWVPNNPSYSSVPN